MKRKTSSSNANRLAATPTLATIAQEAGVSRMTVSRVLRKARYIAPATKGRVLTAVKKLKYRPNPMVSAMMTYVRSGTVHRNAGVLAYITSGPSKQYWRSIPTYAGFFRGASEMAGRRGFRLEEFYLNERGMTMARLSKILYAQGICGVVVGPSCTAHSHLRFEWDKFSAATICHSLLRPLLDRVMNDQYNSMLLALRQLRGYGYQRIGLALSSVDDKRVHHRWSAAYLSHHDRFNRGKHLPIFPLEAWKWPDFFQWISRHKPDVVLSTWTTMHQKMLDGGLCIPKDIGLVCLDLPAGNRTMAGIDQRPEEVGAVAVELVIGQINHNVTGIPKYPRTIMLPGEWVDGPTVRAR